jgi:hypothetical protein
VLTFGEDDVWLLAAREAASTNDIAPPAPADVVLCHRATPAAWVRCRIFLTPVRQQ